MDRNSDEYERLLPGSKYDPSLHQKNTVEEGNREVYTLEEGINALGMGTFQYLLMLYVAFAWASDGMEMLVLSFLGPAAKCEWDLTNSEKSLISSIVFIGMLFGAYCWGAVSDALGRKVGFTATATLTAIAGFASALSPNYSLLVICRGLVGFGLGGIPVAFGLFMEFVPSPLRGRISILMQISWAIGAILEAGLAWILLPTLGWRVLLMFSTAPLVLLLILFPLLPESPHFLVSKGRIAEAEALLVKMAKMNGSSLPPGRLVGPRIIRKPTDGKGALTQARSIFAGMWTELLRVYSKQHAATSAILHTSWLTNAFVYYGLVLLTTELHTQEVHECKMGKMAPMPNSAYGDIMLTTSAESVGQIVAFFLIDYIGRIKSMVIGMAICSLALVPLRLFNLAAHQATVFLFIARGSSLLSFSVLYSYTAEYYPTSMRSFSLGLANVWSRFGGLVAPFIAVSLVDSGRKGIAEIIMIVICGITSIVTVFLRTETAGQRLPDDDGDDEANKDSGHTVGNGSGVAH